MTDAEKSPHLGGHDQWDEGKRAVITLPKSLYRAVQVAAEEEHLLFSEYLRKVLREAVARTDCDECGEEVPGDADYCPYCGTEFEEEDEDQDEEGDEESEDQDESAEEEDRAD